MSRVGIDIGGSFTDAVLIGADGRVHVAKVPSQPAQIEAAFMAGLDSLLVVTGESAADVAYLAHGTTIATNAIVQRTFAKTALITNAGFADVLTIGTQMRRNVYDLWTPEDAPIVPRELCFGVGGRIDAQGLEHEALAEDEVLSAAEAMRDAGVEAVAVMTLFSFLNPAHEKRIAALLAEAMPGVPVTLSHAVVPEFREYIRASTAAANSALLPLVGRYITALENEVASAGIVVPLHLMQSNGGVTPAERARQLPIVLATSGPAAGVIGGARLARLVGEEDVITFDMGGTTADIGIVTHGEAEVRFTSEAAGTPINLPQLDLLCIGAGGGSIATVDEFGALRVGPESAGAAPGPAAYGQGGMFATVTDAHVVLGTLSENCKLAGRLPLDRALALDAVNRCVALPLGLDSEEAASAILRIANANMANAVRMMSVARGQDPRGYALVAIGGAGPMHACSLADEVGIPRIVIPRHPGVAAAYGLLATDIRHDLRRTWRRQTSAISPAELDAELARLEDEARALLAYSAGVAHGESLDWELDLRYRGQAYNLTVPLGARPASIATIRAAEQAFVDEHQRLYDYTPTITDTEIVTIRLRATALTEPIVVDAVGGGVPRAATQRVHDGVWSEWAVHHRDALELGDTIVGPAIIEQADATSVLHRGWSAIVAAGGTLVLERKAEA
ncbi:MAG: hydantoinase/oxoprolinase family protein [Thermoleophilia bacterium]|nr:hydantoinase/oxoprolinase family protein [Thermoleophilia bacterium]